MITKRDLILRCFVIFLLFIVGSFSVLVINKWRLTELYSIETCTQLREPIVSKKQFYHYGTVQSYYFSNSSYLLEPVKLYYPAMFPFFAMASEKDVWGWMNNLYEKNKNNLGTFHCLVDRDKGLGITERYNMVMGWILLLIIVLALLISIVTNTLKNREEIRQYLTNPILYFSHPEGIPPMYAVSDPALPDYERGSYDRTPPSDELSMLSYSISNSSSTEEFLV